MASKKEIKLYTELRYDPITQKQIVVILDEEQLLKEEEAVREYVRAMGL